MALNDPNADQTSARKPRVRVLLNGVTPHGLVEAQITSNNWYQCDQFTLSLALVPGSPYNARWWSQQTDVLADVQIGFLPSGQPEGAANVSWQSILQGGVDQIDVDIIQGTVSVEGRDLSYLLIESKTDEAFPNHTSSQIVTILAQRHNLTPVVTATTTLVDRYYAIDHTKAVHGAFRREQTEWDLCVYLAQREHFDLFVQGKELHFQPKTQPDATPFIVQYQAGAQGKPMRANVETLKLSRNLILAKDIEVDVSSWDSSHKKGFTVTARKTGTKRSSAAGFSSKHGAATQKFAYIFPNLTRAEAQMKAEALAKQITQHERVITFDQPGILGVTPRTRLLLQGTDSDWDQTYYIDVVTRTIGFDSGFTQNVRAKNMDTSSQIALA